MRKQLRYGLSLLISDYNNFDRAMCLFVPTLGVFLVGGFAL